MDNFIRLALMAIETERLYKAKEEYSFGVAGSRRRSYQNWIRDLIFFCLSMGSFLSENMKIMYTNGMHRWIYSLLYPSRTQTIYNRILNNYKSSTYPYKYKSKTNIALALLSQHFAYCCSSTQLKTFHLPWNLIASHAPWLSTIFASFAPNQKDWNVYCIAITSFQSFSIRSFWVGHCLTMTQN